MTVSYIQQMVHAPFSGNPDFDFEIRGVLGIAEAGCSDPGEVLAATSGIGTKDHEGWYRAWLRLGDTAATRAATSAAAGRTVSAARSHLAASTYYGVAVNALSALDRTDDLGPTFAKQQHEWLAFVAADGRGERVEIPYEGTALPGYLFRPAGAEGHSPPLLVGVNGSDGSLAAMWGNCANAALDRGYAVLLFDGPGQQSQLFDVGTSFRPDWENVLTPVYDFAAGLPGIDPARIALYGISQGGYWVPRALTVEHRYAAAIADPAVVDVSTSWLREVPGPVLSVLEKCGSAAFDKDMALGMKFSPETARTWAFRARPYGAAGYAETIEAVKQYTLGDRAADIVTPLFITAPEGEQFWPGQSKQLADATPAVSTLVEFTAVEGADLHCQPLARGLTAQRMFDWLDGVLGR